MKAILLRWKSLKTFYKSLILTAFALALFLLFLPLMLKKSIEYALVQQGAESAQLEKVIINPFSGRLELFNLTVSTEQKQQLKLGHLKVNLAWLDLLQKHINLQTLEVFDTSLFLVYQPGEYVRVGGITFPLNIKQPLTTAESVQEKQAFWGLGVQNLILQNATLNLKTPEISKTLHFENVSVSKTANWEPEKYSQLNFRIQDNKGVLKGKLNAKLFSEKQVIKGPVQISGFDLHTYQGYLPKEWNNVSGIVSGKLNIELRNYFGKINVQQTGQVDIRNFGLQQQDFEIASETIGWDGKLSYETHKDDYTVNADGKWQLEQFTLTQPEQTLQLQDLNWLGQVKVKQRPKGLFVEAHNQLMVSQSVFKKEALNTKIKTLFWKGPLVYQNTKNSSAKNAQKIELKDTQLALENMSVILADLKATSELIQWQGDIDVQPDAKAPVTLSGQVGIANALASNMASKKTILQLAQLKSNMLFKSPQAIQLTELSFNGIGLGQNIDSDSPFIKISGVDVSKIVVEKSDGVDKTQLGKVNIHNVEGNLTLNKQHDFVEVQGLIKSFDLRIGDQQEKTETDTTIVESGADQTKNAVMQLEKLSLKGQNNIVFETQGLNSKLKQNIHLTQLELGALNSKKPSLETPVALNATLGKYSKIELQGKIQPFTQKVNSNLKLKVKELDLYEFSPLIKDTVGYRIKSGALTLDSDIHIKEDMLKSKNHIILKGFELDGSAEENFSTAESNQQEVQDGGSVTGGSTSLALNLLRDNEGKIELDVPVEGDLSDPNFHLDQVIQTAMLNALQSGTKTMLALTLQPYGAIYLAAEYAFKQANTVTLQPISYEVGLNKIKPGMAEYLQKIVALLEKKKSITLKVCGFYNQQDRDYWIQKGLKDQKLQDKLYALARTRQNQIKDWLVGQGSVGSHRLTTCHPTFEDLPETGVLLSM